LDEEKQKTVELEKLKKELDSTKHQLMTAKDNESKVSEK
jgi:hypothetical protein